MKSHQFTHVDFTQLRFLLLSCVTLRVTLLQFDSKTALKVYPKLVTRLDGGKKTRHVHPNI